MLNKINPTKTKAWKKLEKHYKALKHRQMKDFFTEDTARFSKFSVRFEDILIDYSKNIINEETVNLLLQLAREVQLENAIEKMLSGDVINETENRAALHPALRNRSNYPVYVDNKNVMSDVNIVLNQIEEISGKILS
ncbi:glucose-6-phosphate isomerase, partial [bacterium]|nr:glucose-6-phosphate isomerase [bacterium]